MKNIKNMKWSLLLVPVISCFLFVTIITAAPETLSSDLYPKTIQTAMGDLYPKAIKAVEPVSPEEAKSTPAPETTVAVNSSTPSPTTTTPAKTNSTAAQTKQVKTQPSRSSSELTPPSSTSKASAIIATAKQYIGVKYVYGGTTPSGFDCSGFTKYVFAKNSVSLPRVSRDQYQVGTSVSLSNLKAGDLIFFSLAKSGVVDHVGIYVGNGQFINASSSKGVTIYTLGTYWKSAFVGAKRVF